MRFTEQKTLEHEDLVKMCYLDNVMGKVAFYISWQMINLRIIKKVDSCLDDGLSIKNSNKVSVGIDINHFCQNNL